VLGTWALVLAVTAVVTVLGMRFTDGSFDVPGTDSSRAMATLEQEFGANDTTGGSLQLVIQAEGAVSDARAEVAAATSELKALDGVASVSDPFDPARPYVSADGTTAVVEIAFVDLTEAKAETATDEVSAVASELRNAGFRTEIGGSLAGGVPEILGPSEIVGAIVAFLVLLLTFGSLVAAGANMLGALVGVGVGVLGVLAFSAVTPIGSVTPILAVMLGLAVWIDYGLFVLSRFRAELRAGHEVEAAIGRSVATAGSSVLFAGATVIIALVGLTVVGIPFIAEMGLAAAFAVLVAVLMSVTFLPALMSLMGRRALARSERRRRREDAPQSSPRWASRWGRAVTRRPWAAAIGTVIVLGLAAAPVLGMQTSLATPGGEDPDSTQRAAYDLIADEFGAGAQDPLIVLVEAGSGTVDTVNVEAAIRALNDVTAVFPSGTSEDAGAAILTVLAGTGPLDPATIELVRDIRALDVPGVSLAVTGSTAIGLDSDEQLRTALILYVAIIVGLSFILLVILFRSLLVPLIATAGFLLSLGAGLGATVAIFQWAWLDALVQAPQGNPLLSLLPIVVTGILFGLAMDYQVFLVSRIHEAHEQGLTPREAILAGFDRAGSVVVAAAAIMTAVFGGFALSPSSLVGSIALALAVGVVADAFLVRMVLVPALLTLLGRSAWWSPRWLDRVLPHLDVEGGVSEEPALIRAV
jgi:RND superfamily putative drug exporter